MLISDDRRMLFVHIPKTGGASVEQVLREALPDARTIGKERHPRLRRALEQAPEASDYWTFGFVRNPWARMYSWWSMIDRWNHRLGPASGKPQTETDGTRAGNKLWRAAAEYADFDEFVLRGTAEHDRLAMPQVDYLVGDDHRADFIGRTEHLAEDIATIQRELDLPPIELPHRNARSSGSWRDYYTPTTRDRIAKVYAKDVAEFDYRF